MFVVQTYLLRYQLLDDGSYSIGPNHVTDPDGQSRTDVGPLVLSAGKFREWFARVV